MEADDVAEQIAKLLPDGYTRQSVSDGSVVMQSREITVHCGWHSGEPEITVSFDAILEDVQSGIMIIPRLIELADFVQRMRDEAGAT